MTSRRSGEFAPKVYALEVCDTSARSVLPLLPLPHFADSLAQNLDIWGEFPNFAHYLYRQGKIPFFAAFGIVTFSASGLHRESAPASHHVTILCCANIASTSRRVSVSAPLSARRRVKPERFCLPIPLFLER